MKTIVILSPDIWGKMMLSKMHFALELATSGNRVFFVNPPAFTKVEYDEGVLPSNLKIIHLKPIRYRRILLNKFFSLYGFLSGRYVREIKQIAGNSIDQLWCFNPHLVTDLSQFKADCTIFFLYDFYSSRYIQKIANTADTVVSVSQIILNHYKNTTPPKLLLHHGLSKPFMQKAEKILEEENYWKLNPDRKIKIGYSGNLLILGLDIRSIVTIINNNPQIEFHFWGAGDDSSNNVAGERRFVDSVTLLKFLSEKENVFLHGIKTPEALAAEIQQMDAFIIFYDAEKGISKASNSHKIMEFLSTGKVIISSPISNYEGTDYFPMANEKVRLVELFDQVINNLEAYNHPSLQRKRIEFALENSYGKQIERIEEWLKLI